MTTRPSSVLTLLMLTALLATGCSASEDPEPEETTSAASSAASSAAPTPSSSPATTGSDPAESDASEPPASSTPADAAGSLPSVTTAPSEAPASSPSPSAPTSADAGAGQQDPASLTVVVNKQNPLTPPQWAPSDLTALSVSTTKSGLTLRQPASEAASELFDAAAADGISLSVVSAYRSYDYQVGTYQHWVNQQGASAADRISARPGYSEHQTGLAMDVVGSDGACTLQTCFESTAAGRWVAEHAAEHGWVIRYPAGAESITGYSYEPWHLRYVGHGPAAEIMAAGGVMETAWGLPAAPSY
ncbi:MAG: M15 family metallopeptidase [Micrococcaceae bacterium]